MRVRAFTILEIMVVVLLATAISAILIPTLVGRVTGSKLDGAASAIRFGAALVGAEATRNGELTAYVAERHGDEWVLYAEPVEPDGIASLLHPDPTVERPEAAPEVAPPRKRVEVGAFEGVEIRRERLFALLPADEADGVSAEELFGIEPEDVDDLDVGFGPGGGAAPERRVFGVFFADGSARPGSTLYLIADEGRQQRSVTLLPLTGKIQIETLDPFGEMPADDERGGRTADDSFPLPPSPMPRGAAAGGGP